PRLVVFFFSSRRRHTRSTRDWSSDVCSSDLGSAAPGRVRVLSIASGSNVLDEPGQAAGERAGGGGLAFLDRDGDGTVDLLVGSRSEERRVGKERSSQRRTHQKQKAKLKGQDG